jgi:outer membrane protein OmpA-like peptidoglycan-associated protein/opacity protein-like surface antigen
MILNLREDFMLSWKRAILPLFLLALCGAPAMADGERGDWEVGVYAGYAFLDDYDRVSPLSSYDMKSNVLFGVRGGYWFSPRWSSELSWQTVGTQTGLAIDADVESFRLNGLFHFKPGTSFRPFVTLGLGDESLDVPGLSGSGDVSFNAGGGLHAWVEDNMALRMEARYISADHGAVIDGKQGNIETTIGLSWIWGGAPPVDSDGDGVGDRKDRCPDTPLGATVDEKGCPSDSDGDGVFDGIDRCADTPEGHVVDATGCSMDSDGDGVHDGPDKCPDTPMGATVDADGCPSDSDGDGVYDGIDKCADTPKGDVVDATGCSMDGDGDGVNDGPDQCPDTPEGHEVDARGCSRDSDGDGVHDGPDKCPDTPSGVEVDVTGCAVLFEGEQKTLVLENVLFEFNSSELTAASKAVLDEIAGPLVESFPDVRLEIGGHTDAIGPETYNRTLSQRRAESVVAHFVSAGVDESRLEAKGYGEDHPVASNDDDEGRAKNRRVELRRLN